MTVEAETPPALEKLFEAQCIIRAALARIADDEDEDLLAVDIPRLLNLAHKKLDELAPELDIY